jgi:hypothetical protein
MSNDDTGNMLPVTGKILKRTVSDDPADPEHEIFEIEYTYTHAGRDITGTAVFSLNTMHVIYATLGELLNVPKLPFDYDDFLESLSENKPIAFLVDKDDPERHLVRWNDIAYEVFRHPNMWT